MKTRHGKEFNLSLGNTGLVLKPGVYDIMIEPIWNSFAENNEAYKDVLIDLYSTCDSCLIPMKHESGMKLLVKALKDIALNVIPISQRIRQW